MIVELRPHIGIRYDGAEVKFDQFRVFANDVDVGFLSFDESLPIMFHCNQTDEITNEIVAKCAAITKRVVKPPRAIYTPPEIDNSLGADESESDDDQ